MSGQRYTPEFKDEAVKQVLDRGCSVAEVSERLGVTPHSLYKRVNAVKPENSTLQATELLEAKRRQIASPKLPPASKATLSFNRINIGLLFTIDLFIFY